MDAEAGVATGPAPARPRLVEAVGACPPEDCGGPWGYADFVAAMTDRKHPRHREMRDWFDGSFDPAAVDVEALRAAVDRVAEG